MVLAPFRDFLALRVLNGNSDLPKHLLAGLADSCAKGSYGFRGVKVENRHEVLIAKILFRLQSAAGHNRVGDADCGG